MSADHMLNILTMFRELLPTGDGQLDSYIRMAIRRVETILKRARP
jgi:hypothetical protein